MFGDENSDPAQPVPGVFRRWPMAAGTCFLAGALLFGIAYLICVAVRGDEPMFPAYFLFLLVSAVLPSMFCFHVAFHFVHWRALTVSWLFTLSVSQFWEASLGLPYQWWDYNRSAMMGIFIRPHCDLPIEAMIVWTLASWTTVIVYETVLSLLRLRQERGLRGALRLLRGLPDDLDEAKRLESARPRSAR